jgi:hypothetical protein
MPAALPATTGVKQREPIIRNGCGWLCAARRSEVRGKQLVNEATNKQSEPIHDGQQGAMPAAARRPRTACGRNRGGVQATRAPVTEGLEPEAGTDLQPPEPETTMHHDRATKYGRIPAGIAVVCEETTPATACGRIRR